MESRFGRFMLYQDARLNLLPIDAEQPRLGGKVTASVYSFDVRTFTFQNKQYFGVYGEDFLTFAEFGKDCNYPIDDEATLLKIFDEQAQADGTVVDKHSFRFENSRVLYSREVDGDAKDAELEHAIEESELSPQVYQTWSETLFYGAGNKAM